uniref:Uncharacterized protein n=1 Tax=Hucho hucho TaxID=62062 RepID=A0A4W5N057_9TELE
PVPPCAGPGWTGPVPLLLGQKAGCCSLASDGYAATLLFTWRANLDTSRPLLLGVVNGERWGLVRAGRRLDGLSWAATVSSAPGKGCVVCLVSLQVERFWLQSDAVVCVLVGLCLNWTHTGLERRLGHGGLWRAGGWLFTIGLLVHMVPSNHRECDQSSNRVVEQFGRELLLSVPPNSIILTRGDLPGNSLHYCQGVWPDVRLVDQEVTTFTLKVICIGFKSRSGLPFIQRYDNIIVNRSHT